MRHSPSDRLLCGIAFSIVLVAGAGCGETKAKAPPPGPPLVLVTPVVRRDVALYSDAVGTTAGFIDADIRARVRGFLETQHYKDGASVRRGQLLFTIDPSEYQAAISSAKAAMARAETALLHNKAQLERRQGLIKSNVVSEQELEDAQASERDAADQVEAARAQLRQAQLNLSYTEMRSPIDGVAGVAQVRVGNLVGQDGATLLTTVSQVDPMRVNFPIAEAEYVRNSDRLRQLDKRSLAWAKEQFAKLSHGGLAEGDDPGLELLLVDGRRYDHRGVVFSANRQVDSATGTILMQALFPNPDGVLRPGQYARVRIQRPEAGHNVLVVPETALMQVQGTYSVAVVGADNRVQLRRIEVGPSEGTVRIVTSGVSEGEKIVSEGVQKVSDGAPVTPKPAPAPKTIAAHD